MSDDSKDALLTPTHFLPVDDSSRTPPSRGRGFKKVSKSPSSNRATPSVLGPINPKLPDYKPNKKGELVLQKWSDSQHSDDTRENRSRVKAEVECAKLKIEAQDARAEADHLQKLLRQSEENATESRIRLNEERARHAETADQARALTHVAAQLRSKTEKYEGIITNQTKTIKKLQTSNKDIEEKLKLQDARVDALARICAALEQQVRDAALAQGATQENIDVAAVWRQKAYKVMVQMSHTEAQLTAENRNLRRRQTSRHGSLAARSPSPGRRSNSDSPNSLPRPPKARI